MVTIWMSLTTNIYNFLEESSDNWSDLVHSLEQTFKGLDTEACGGSANLASTLCILSTLCCGEVVQPSEILGKIYARVLGGPFH